MASSSSNSSNKTTSFWTVILCSVIIIWFYRNLTLDIDYNRHAQLVDSVTGKKSKPSELLDLNKIINPTDEYINSTSANQRLYDLEYLMNFENPLIIDHSYSKKEDMLVSGWPVANENKCGNQLNWILEKLGNNTDYTNLRGRLGYELTSLMDSFGKPESGTYSGVVNWLGSYKNCERLSLNNKQIKTRYCIGRLKPSSWPNNETIHPETTIRYGLCLPESCDTNSFQSKSLSSSIEKLAKISLPSEHFRDFLDLKSIFCLPDERSPIRKLPTSGYIYLGIVLSWLSLVIIASIIHECFIRKNPKIRSLTVVRCEVTETNQVKYTVNEKQIFETAKEPLLNKIMLALSVRCSMKIFKGDIFKVKNNNRVRVHLGSLDFFKIGMAIAVVLGHSGYLSSIYTRSLTNRIEINTNPLGKLALSVSRCVDTFFLFSGLLTTYTLMSKFNRKQLSNPIIWLLVNLGVFVRLTPMFMLIYWYSKSISPYTGSGPWWDYGVDKFSMKGCCMTDPWWKSIPYFGSVGTPPVPSCVLPAWFIVSYSQISLLLPTITFLLYTMRNFLSRLALVGFLLVASALSIGSRLYYQTSVKEEAFTLYGGLLADLLEKFESTGHITTLGRVGSVSVGCFVGYLLYLYQERKILQWPAWLRSNSVLALTMLAHAFIIFLPLVGHVIYLYTGRLVTLEEFVISNISLIIIWPILNSIFFINITTINNHSVIVRFLSHSFWHVFNRLGLCIYLVHWEVIFIGITSYEQAPGYGFLSDTMKMWAYGLYLSIVIAFVLHIFVESPLARVTAVIIYHFFLANSKTISLKGKSITGSYDNNNNKMIQQDFVDKSAALV